MMGSEKFSESCYSLQQWQSWVNAKCTELQLPSVYGYPSIREWMYGVGKQYGWSDLCRESFIGKWNLFELYTIAYNFLVERSYLEIVNTCDYSEMLEIL